MPGEPREPCSCSQLYSEQCSVCQVSHWASFREYLGCSANWRHLSCFLPPESLHKFLSKDDSPSSSVSDHNPRSWGWVTKEFPHQLRDKLSRLDRPPRTKCTWVSASRNRGRSMARFSEIFGQRCGLLGYTFRI